MKQILFGFMVLFFVPIVGQCSANEAQTAKAAIVLKLQPGAVHNYQFDNKEIGLDSPPVMNHLIQQGFIAEDLHINTLEMLPEIMKGFGYNDKQIKWIQSVLEQSQRSSVLSIELSFIGIQLSEKPHFGVHYMADSLPLNNAKTFFGFKNGDGVSHIKLPTHDVTIDNETYSYVEAGSDRQENGMFKLYPQRSDPISYSLKGVFYAQGHVFVIDEILHPNEEKVCYESKGNQS